MKEYFDPILIELTKQTEQLLQEKFYYKKISVIYMMGSFLRPKYKHLKFLKPGEQNMTLDTITKFMIYYAELDKERENSYWRVQKKWEKVHYQLIKC